MHVVFDCVRVCVSRWCVQETAAVISIYVLTNFVAALAKASEVHRVLFFILFPRDKLEIGDISRSP